MRWGRWGFRLLGHVGICREASGMPGFSFFIYLGAGADTFQVLGFLLIGICWCAKRADLSGAEMRDPPQEIRQCAKMRNAPDGAEASPVAQIRRFA